MSFWQSASSFFSPFTSETYMTREDSLFVVSVTVFMLIALFLNMFLLFMIIWKSPRSLTPYKVYLANTTLTQLSLSVIGLLSQPRVLSKNQYTIVIYLGPVQYFGEWLSYMSYVSIVHLSHSAFISLMLSMIYRYFSIKSHQFSMKYATAQCLIGYFFSFSFLVSCATIKVDSSLASNQKVLQKSVDHLENYRMVISTDISNQPALIILIFVITIGLAPIYGIMFWCRYLIFKTLKTTHSSHSQVTRENSTRLVQALTIQSILPLISVFPASTFYCLSQLSLVNPAIYSYMIIPCLSFGCIADPLVTMRFVLPYRKFILRTFGRLPVTRDSVVSVQSRTEHINNKSKRLKYN